MKQYTVKEGDDGTIQWFNEDGKLHREGGPAIKRANGILKWFRNGLLHNEDGPAVVLTQKYQDWYYKQYGSRPDGTRQWYLSGVRLTEEEFNKAIKQQTPPEDKWEKIVRDIVQQLKDGGWVYDGEDALKKRDESPALYIFSDTLAELFKNFPSKS
jgi:hypothetical protein